MSQVLKLELSDEVFTALEQQAKSAGTSPAHLIATLLEEKYQPLSEAENQQARERFERHFGEVEAPYAVGSDNEKIDEDLAKAYANEAS
jgi:hypothetical protein